LSFFFQAEDGIRAFHVTGVQTCALPILPDDIHTVMVSKVGDPGYHLVDLAREGDLLVLGRSRRGLFSRMFLPSTSMYCARHAKTTVVIVQQPTPPDEPEVSADRTRRYRGRGHD